MASRKFRTRSYKEMSRQSRGLRRCLAADNKISRIYPVTGEIPFVLFNAKIPVFSEGFQNPSFQDTIQ